MVYLRDTMSNKEIRYEVLRALVWCYSVVKDNDKEKALKIINNKIADIQSQDVYEFDKEL